MTKFFESPCAEKFGPIRLENCRPFLGNYLYFNLFRRHMKLSLTWRMVCLGGKDAELIGITLWTGTLPHWTLRAVHNIICFRCCVPFLESGR